MRLTKKSIEEIEQLLDKGKCSTNEIIREYNKLYSDYTSYYLDNDMIRKKRGHDNFMKKYNLLCSMIKKRSPV